MRKIAEGKSRTDRESHNTFHRRWRKSSSETSTSKKKVSSKGQPIPKSLSRKSRRELHDTGLVLSASILSDYWDNKSLTPEEEREFEAFLAKHDESKGVFSGFYQNNDDNESAVFSLPYSSDNSVEDDDGRDDEENDKLSFMTNLFSCAADDDSLDGGSYGGLYKDEILFAEGSCRTKGSELDITKTKYDSPSVGTYSVGTYSVANSSVATLGTLTVEEKQNVSTFSRVFCHENSRNEIKGIQSDESRNKGVSPIIVTRSTDTEVTNNYQVVGTSNAAQRIRSGNKQEIVNPRQGCGRQTEASKVSKEGRNNLQQPDLPLKRGNFLVAAYRDIRSEEVPFKNNSCRKHRAVFLGENSSDHGDGRCAEALENCHQKLAVDTASYIQNQKQVVHLPNKGHGMSLSSSQNVSVNQEDDEFQRQKSNIPDDSSLRSFQEVERLANLDLSCSQSEEDSLRSDYTPNTIDLSAFKFRTQKQTPNQDPQFENPWQLGRQDQQSIQCVYEVCSVSDDDEFFDAKTHSPE